MEIFKWKISLRFLGTSYRNSEESPVETLKSKL